MDKNILSNLVILSVQGANRIYAKTNSKTVRENRNLWGLAIKIKGHTEYISNGKAIISDNQHITLLPKGSSYSWESFGGECLMIEFEANIEGQMLYSFNISDCARIVSLFNNIERNRTKGGPEIKNIKNLYDILTILLESSAKEYIPTEKAGIIAPAVDYITKNFRNPDISVPLLSEISGVSCVYFRKLFTKIYGVPPMKYVQILRMNKAADIFKSDYNSIESVAYSLGYNSVYHFSKMFKNYFGVSPSNYQKY